MAEEQLYMFLWIYLHMGILKKISIFTANCRQTTWRLIDGKLSKNGVYKNWNPSNEQSYNWRRLVSIIKDLRLQSRQVIGIVLREISW